MNSSRAEAKYTFANIYGSAKSSFCGVDGKACCTLTEIYNSVNGGLN
ncbi:hypothetical protein [Veronia nyctiphanis]|nr:hypothetical protein [Veronia nyctiphanis]